MDAQNATDQRKFDRAVAYFNAGRYYEAHEDWEDLWNEAEGAHRLWLQGLIQYAAAFVHFSRGYYPRGFSVLMRQATEKVEGYDGDTHQIQWPRLADDLGVWISHGEQVGAGADLVADAPGPVPLIHYVDGFQPDPLPLEDDDDD
ncbi:MAG: DUF309 domain-containing protein [Planctomycetota bacterium]|nr:DUF309 domain-containing protein [Planctomycetota bacterium]